MSDTDIVTATMDHFDHTWYSLMYGMCYLLYDAENADEVSEILE